MKLKKFPQIVGQQNHSRLPNGKKARVIRLNNAATTPPFERTLTEVTKFLETYGALHRGSGPNATITFEKVQEALKVIKGFFGLGSQHSILFTQNTSDAINLFARMLRLKSSDLVITSEIEHTSNNLPWHFNTSARVVTVKAFPDGSLDYVDLKKKARLYRKRLKVISLTGASNQTGFIPDVKRLAKIAHENNALLFIDAAQLAPHRPIHAKKQGIDAFAFSAHKLYAPFGLGVLVLPTLLLETTPVNPGGGSIDMISDQTLLWAPQKQRHQIGTWNVTGIIALAASCKELQRIGWKQINWHEKNLLQYFLKEIEKIPGIIQYVSPDKYLSQNRIATIPFNIVGSHHSLTSSILAHEYGIETRAGTICNHKLVRKWFHVKEAEQHRIEKQIQIGNRLASYGIVRASIGIQNSKQDIKQLVRALRTIVQKGPQLKYRAVKKEASFIPSARKKVM